MKKNPLLYLALLFSKGIRIFIVIGLAFLVSVLIHHHLYPQAYRSVQVTVDQGGFNFFEGEAAVADSYPSQSTDASSPVRSSGKRAYLNDLKPFSLWFNSLQLAVSLILFYCIIHEVIRLLRSVQALQPFNAANIRSFRSIGYFCLSLLVLNSLHFLNTARTSFIGFHVNFTLLIFVLTAFILAEIFREGQRLYEQEKLTI